MWEPGGVLTEHDMRKGLEKCYKHGRLMRLMQWLSSMLWQGIKSRELDMLAACSFFDVELWLELCSCDISLVEVSVISEIAHIQNQKGGDSVNAYSMVEHEELLSTRKKKQK